MIFLKKYKIKCSPAVPVYLYWGSSQDRRLQLGLLLSGLLPILQPKQLGVRTLYRKTFHGQNISKIGHCIDSRFHNQKMFMTGSFIEREEFS